MKLKLAGTSKTNQENRAGVRADQLNDRNKQRQIRRVVFLSLLAFTGGSACGETKSSTQEIKRSYAGINIFSAAIKGVSARIHCRRPQIGGIAGWAGFDSEPRTADRRWIQAGVANTGQRSSSYLEWTEPINSVSTGSYFPDRNTTAEVSVEKIGADWRAIVNGQMITISGLENLPNLFIGVEEVGEASGYSCSFNNVQVLEDHRWRKLSLTEATGYSTEGFNIEG